MRIIQQVLAEREKQQVDATAREESINQFKDDLTKALETLADERKQWLRTVANKDEQIEVLNNDLERIQVLNDNLQRKNDSLEDHMTTLQQRLSQALDKTSQDASQLARERNHWQQSNNQAQQELDRLREESQNEISQLMKRNSEEAKNNAELKNQILTLEGDLRKTQMELSAAVREKDNMKSEVSLMQAKHEAEVTKREAAMQADVERQVLQRLSAEQERTNATENRLRDAHKAQIDQLTSQFEEEKRHTQSRFRQQLEDTQGRLHAMQQQHQQELTALQNQLMAAQQLSETREHLAPIFSQLQRLLKEQAEASNQISSQLQTVVSLDNSTKSSTRSQHLQTMAAYNRPVAPVNASFTGDAELQQAIFRNATRTSDLQSSGIAANDVVASAQQSVAELSRILNDGESRTITSGANHSGGYNQHSYGANLESPFPLYTPPRAFGSPQRNFSRNGDPSFAMNSPLGSTNRAMSDADRVKRDIQMVLQQSRINAQPPSPYRPRANSGKASGTEQHDDRGYERPWIRGSMLEADKGKDKIDSPTRKLATAARSEEEARRHDSKKPPNSPGKSSNDGVRRNPSKPKPWR